MSKDIKLLAKYTARLSVSVLNVFNHFNPLDVHANTADPLLGVFFGHFQTALPRGFRNPVLEEAPPYRALFLTLPTSWATRVDHDQNQLGFLGFGGQTGIAGTKPSRLGIRTFGRLCASMTSVS